MNTKCNSGKIRYSDESIALEALIQHHIRNDYKAGGGPINVYECNECGDWHFTSKGPVNSFLNDDDVKKRINSERISFHWERKLK